METGRPEGLHQVEDEFRIERTPGEGPDTLRHDDLPARIEDTVYLAEREGEVVRHVQGVDRVDDRDAVGRYTLLGEGPVHVERCEGQRRRPGAPLPKKPLSAA